MNPIDIIVPIYGGLDELKACLESVQQFPQKIPCELILINDCSPFPEIGDYLEDFMRRNPQVNLLENPQNLGFVGTVNRGMKLHPERDVILLNSDTQVTGDWLDRIADCASQPDIATVTPFSNNATICSFPGLCLDNDLPDGFSLAKIHSAFSTANAKLAVEIPTGVGFCLFIRRDALNQIGYFDEETFGRGYGEENDFCRRAVAAGLKNLLCCDSFVHHSGGASFAEEKNERAEAAQQILDRLYPDYHKLIHQHIALDPQGVHRLAAWLQLLRNSRKPKILHLTHHLGGGTLKHIEELFDHLGDQAHFLLLKPLQDGRIEIDLSGHKQLMKLEFKLPDQMDELVKVLHSIPISRIHFHHTLGLETSCWGLPNRLNVPFDVTLHDYYFINANPTQTDANGRYTDQLDQQASPYPLPVSLHEWQKNQQALLYGAERVICPSEFTQRIFRKHFPDANYLTAYHPEWEKTAPYPDISKVAVAENESLKILVFGAISIEKGANLLENLATIAKQKKLPLTFHLLGYAYRPLEHIIEHGSYHHNSIVEKIKELQPHLIWFPALWPETYSYTLSEALASGFPIIAPDLGSFPERLEGRPLSWIAPWNQPDLSWLELFQKIRKELLHPPQSPVLSTWSDQHIPPDDAHFYHHQYITSRVTEKPSVESPNHQLLTQLIEQSRANANPATSGREQLLIKLVHLRHSKPGRWLSRLIPTSLQRIIKRKLSRKPIHELL